MGPKVRQEQIWRSYQNDARGLVDEDLFDEVGWALYSHCQSILWVTDRNRVPCPRCHHVIRCPSERWSREVPIVCPECAWQATFGQWRDSWRHRDLHGGNALPAFRSFMEEWERTTSPRVRMLLIDRLIHAFHWSLRKNQRFGPAERNLIEGRYDEVVAFLDRLSYGEGSTPGTTEQKAEWRDLKEHVKGEQRHRWRRPDENRPGAPWTIAPTAYLYSLLRTRTRITARAPGESLPRRSGRVQYRR